MNFSDYDVTRRTRKGNFLKQIDQLIDWSAIERAIAVHYAPVSDAAGRPAYSGLLLFKMLLVGIWNGGLSDESVEDMANSNLHVMRFLELSLEDDVPDHSVFQNPADSSECVGWIIRASQSANTHARYHGQERLPC